MSIIFRYSGLPYEKIVWIFYNKFKPINLYRFCHMHGFRFDSLQDHNQTTTEDGMLRLRTMSRTYKNFGKSFYKMWANAFHNYTTILVLLFGKEASDIHSALAEFYSNVYKLSTISK